MEEERRTESCVVSTVEAESRGSKEGEVFRVLYHGDPMGQISD